MPALRGELAFPRFPAATGWSRHGPPPITLPPRESTGTNCEERTYSRTP
jgi:hypothetical protein